MNCFYHPASPAIGLCKHCQRGLCSECAAVVDDVLACKARHEDEVQQLEQLTARNLFQSKRVASAYNRNAILFTGFGAIQYRFLGLQALFFILIGLFLLYAASANYFEGRKHK
jgi:predicted Fe-S protein YdhL (DUF1289 family)